MTQTYCSSNQVIQYKKWLKKLKQVWKLPYISATHIHTWLRLWQNEQTPSLPVPSCGFQTLFFLLFGCVNLSSAEICLLLAAHCNSSSLTSHWQERDQSTALRQTHRRLDKDRLSACNFSCVCAESEKKWKLSASRAFDSTRR